MAALNCSIALLPNVDPLFTVWTTSSLQRFHGEHALFAGARDLENHRSFAKMQSLQVSLFAAGLMSTLAWLPAQSSGFVPPPVHLHSNARVWPPSSLTFFSLLRRPLVRPLPLQLGATAAGPAASQRNDEEEETRRRKDVWGHTWYPLHFEQHADKTAPSACTLLEAPVVFWWDPIAEEWAAALDVCPHRLVPLSEGRVCPKSGGIECPYHGWTFHGSDGTCTRIPQLEPGRKINQRRARATALPVRVRAGILWCWAAKLVSSDAPPDEGKLDRLQVDCIGKPGVLNLDYFRDLPMDATILTENVLDPVCHPRPVRCLSRHGNACVYIRARAQPPIPTPVKSVLHAP